MKKDIHPKYFPDAKIICACGNVIEAGSTVKEMKVEICAACHPFCSKDKEGKNSKTKSRNKKSGFEEEVEEIVFNISLKKLKQKCLGFFCFFRNPPHPRRGGATFSLVRRRATSMFFIFY